MNLLLIRLVLVYAPSQVALRNALAREAEVPLRNPGRAPEYAGRTDAKREIEFQERVRSQMEEVVSKPFVQMRVRKNGLRECPRLNDRSFGRHFVTLENDDNISFETASGIWER